jgi:hypothetical protein
MMTGWRINNGPMDADDCHRDHVSTLWVDGYDSDDAERAGVSCCQTLDDLVSYFADGDPGCRTGRNANFSGAYLVEIAGDKSDDESWDDGEMLLHPTAILSCVPVEATSFLADLAVRMNAACAAGRRVVYDAERGEMVTESMCSLCDGAGHIEEEACPDCDGRGWVRE